MPYATFCGSRTYPQLVATVRYAGVFICLSPSFADELDWAENYLRDYETVEVLSQKEIDIVARLRIFEEFGCSKNRA